MNKNSPTYPPLRPELASYLIHDGPTAHLKHPIVQCDWYHPEHNERLNRWFESSSILLADAIAAKDWHTAIFLYQRGWRLDRFEHLATASEHAAQMSDEDYWESLGFVIVDQEDCYRQRAYFSRLLVKTKRSKALRHLLMTPEEKESLAAMPPLLPVYRGCQAFNKKGWSWTLAKDKAIWFSKRCYRGTPLVLSGEVRKDDVLAYFTGRGESEILIAPNAVKVLGESVPHGGLTDAQVLPA